MTHDLFLSVFIAFKGSNFYILFASNSCLTVAILIDFFACMAD